MIIARIGKLLAICTLALALPAMALSLDEAKSKGVVGEQADGYLGLVNNNAAADARALVDSINSKRRTLYRQKAANAGVAPEIMEQRTGQRLQEMAPVGEYIRQSDGRWVRK